MSNREVGSARGDEAKSRLADSSEVDDELANPFVLEDVFPSAENLFAPYRAPAANVEDVIVALDTNALLLPYKIGRDDLGALGEVYRALAQQDRVVVPARVVREFIRLRDQKLGDMIQGLNNNSSRVVAPEGKLSPLLEGVEGYKEVVDAANAVTEARRTYLAAHGKLVDIIRSWRGEDPVTALYNEVFVGNRLIEVGGERATIAAEWDDRRKKRIPPGYKDSSKPDTGIGDFIIWKSLLQVGTERKKDLIFVTGEEKSDWFVRSGGEPVYPRPELIDEYRRASGGRNLRLSTLHELLVEMKAPAAVVEEVRVAEASANSEALAVAVTPDIPMILPSRISFDYSINDGVVQARRGAFAIDLKFSKASDKSIHFYRTPRTPIIARLKNVASGERVSVEDLETSSRSYSLEVGDAFFASNARGDMVVGRILSIADDSRGAAEDNVTFDFRMFKAGGKPYAP